jgi:putative peptidoglycan lipid II flippase
MNSYTTLFKKILTSFLFPKGQESIRHALIRSSALNLLARGLGYLRQIAIAVLLGFSIKTDAFFMALSLMGVFLIFVDVFDSIGVPNLVRARLKNPEKFKRLAGLLFSFTLILSISALFLSLLLMPLILKIPRGFTLEALNFTQIAYLLLIPYMFFSFLFNHFGAVLRSERRFTAYFVGEFILTIFNFLFTILGLLLTSDWRVLPLSLSMAQGLATLYMFYTGREFLHLKFYFDDTVKYLLKTFFYLSALYGVFHLYILVDRAFASYLGEKAVSALSYGLMIAASPTGIIKLQHMAITALSEEPRKERLQFFLKKIFLTIPPMALIFFLFPTFIVKLLFGYGKFSHLDVNLTAEALRYYALSLPFFFAWPILYRYFQVKENLRALFFIALFGVFVNFIMNYLLVFKLSLGLTGICLGTFIAYIFLCGLSYFLVR